MQPRRCWAFTAAFLLAPLALGLVSGLGGCRTVEYGFDNPAVRALQEASLEADPATRVGGRSLDQFFGARTAWILPETSALVQTDADFEGQMVNVGGRATAISPDGYYLTAHHVVEGAAPVMVIPPGFRAGGRIGSEFIPGYLGATLVPGRVVATYPPADLALVWFDFRPAAYFDRVREEPERGLEVFTGSPVGYVVGDERIGNGPFKAAGEVLGSRRIRGGERARRGTRVFTSITARGGMSGAPVADRGGRLIGILVRGRWSRWTGLPVRSEWEMIPLEEILGDVARDRASAGRGRTGVTGG